MTKTSCCSNSQDDLSHLSEAINLNTATKGQATSNIYHFATMTGQSQSAESIPTDQNASFKPNCSNGVIAGGNAMRDYRHIPFDEEIVDAMSRYNASHPYKFKFIDAYILNLICVYTLESRPFDLSNEALASLCFTTKPTVQKSINKLLDHNLASKAIQYYEGKRHRYLTCNDNVLQEFKISATL